MGGDFHGRLCSWTTTSTKVPQLRFAREPTHLVLNRGKFHLGVSWVHLSGLKGKREQYNGMMLVRTPH